MEGSPDPRTDGELLVATPTEPEAFAVFYRRHVRGVLAFFRRRAGTPELSFDLTAETFAAALEASPRYELRARMAVWNRVDRRSASRRARACPRRTGLRGAGHRAAVLTERGPQAR